MNKNIVVCILLSIVTCGIYSIYWFWCITETARTVNPAEYETTGGMAILFCIITCGVYTIYWHYKMGKALTAINGGADNSVLYLVLSLFGLSIVNFCLMQNDINNAFPVA